MSLFCHMPAKPSLKHFENQQYSKSPACRKQPPQWFSAKPPRIRINCGCCRITQPTCFTTSVPNVLLETTMRVGQNIGHVMGIVKCKPITTDPWAISQLIHGLSTASWQQKCTHCLKRGAPEYSTGKPMAYTDRRNYTRCTAIHHRTFCNACDGSRQFTTEFGLAMELRCMQQSCHSGCLWCLMIICWESGWLWFASYPGMVLAMSAWDCIAIIQFQLSDLGDAVCELPVFSWKRLLVQGWHWSVCLSRFSKGLKIQVAAAQHWSRAQTNLPGDACGNMGFPKDRRGLSQFFLPLWNALTKTWHLGALFSIKTCKPARSHKESGANPGA